jgi:DNA-binding GntR family transcriptional regulator
MTSRLGLSRPTARQAIQELVKKGLLVRKRGVGTQVVRSQFRRDERLSSLNEDLAKAGRRPSTRLLEFRVGPLDPEIRDAIDAAVEAAAASVATAAGDTTRETAAATSGRRHSATGTAASAATASGLCRSAAGGISACTAGLARSCWAAAASCSAPPRTGPASRFRLCGIGG